MSVRVHPWLVLLLILFPSPLCTQPKPQAESPKDDIIDVRWADKIRRTWNGKTISLLTGHVDIRHGDTTLLADRVEYDETAGVAVATGSLRIGDSEADITGDKVTVYFKERKGVAEGSVKVAIKPKPRKKAESGESSPSGEPTTVSCERVEYLYRAKKATATGSVRIVRKEREILADKVFYDGNAETLDLAGGIHGKLDRDQPFSAKGRVKMSLKEGEEWIEMELASGTFRVKSGDETQEPKDAAQRKESGE